MKFIMLINVKMPTITSIDRWGLRVDRWRTKSWQMGTKHWQMGDQDLTDGGPRVDRRGTNSWQIGTKSWQIEDQELADGGPRVDRWGSRVGICWTGIWKKLVENKSHFICTKVSIKKMRLSEPGHEISNNEVCTASKGSDAQSDKSRC